MEKTEERSNNNKNKLGAVVAKLTELESLVEAFDGCCAVFHTSAFVDPAGLSGYSVSLFLSLFASYACGILEVDL